MRTIPITVMIRPDGIDVNPTYANVPNGSDDVRLRWMVVGGSFPASDCFAWKDRPSGAPAVGCPSGQANVIESAVYRNDASDRRVWAYRISVVVDGRTIRIDPEVNNEPPNRP